MSLAEYIAQQTNGVPIQVTIQEESKCEISAQNLTKNSQINQDLMSIQSTDRESIKQS